MVTCWKQLRDRIQEHTDLQEWWGSGSDTEEEENYRSYRMLHTIAKTFLKKRFLLNILFFIFENEEEIEETHQDDLNQLQELVEEDTTEWMELLDYLQTLKNNKP